MATNRTRIRGRQLALVPTDGGAASGDPGLCGQLPFVSLNGKGNAGNTVPQTVDTLGVYSLSVKGVNAGGNNAVAAGDLLYYVVGDTPPISKKVAGVQFGIAMGVPTAASGGDSGYASGTAVASGATTTIDVRLGGVS